MRNKKIIFLENVAFRYGLFEKFYDILVMNTYFGFHAFIATVDPNLVLAFFFFLNEHIIHKILVCIAYNTSIYSFYDSFMLKKFSFIFNFLVKRNANELRN